MKSKLQVIVEDWPKKIHHLLRQLLLTPNVSRANTGNLGEDTQVENNVEPKPDEDVQEEKENEDE